jgi:hypothetical protein
MVIPGRNEFIAELPPHLMSQVDQSLRLVLGLQ